MERDIDQFSLIIVRLGELGQAGFQTCGKPVQIAPMCGTRKEVTHENWALHIGASKLGYQRSGTYCPWSLPIRRSFRATVVV